jgi:hypothetical protein
MGRIRELMTDERSAVAASGLVAAAFLVALGLFGIWELIDSVADIHERATRGRMRV